jgi:hypothetical protein
MFSIWNEHDHCTELLGSVIAQGGAQILPEAFRPNGSEDHFVVAREDVCVFDVRTNDVAILEQVGALVEQSMCAPKDSAKPME